MTNHHSFENWDWSKISEASVKEILRQGEARLTDMLAVSVAADQRATTLGSTFGTLAAGLFAADATLLTVQKLDTAAAMGIAAAAFGSLVASLVCAYAARPIDFYVSGYEPKMLSSTDADEIWLLRYICQDVQRRIDANKENLSTAARLTTLGMGLEILSVIAGAILFIALHTWS